MSHPIFKTGKLAPKQDERTLLFSSVLRTPLKLPASYGFDIAHPGCRPHMYLNDTYGCCVISDRAEKQIRLDLLRTGKVPTITDTEIRKEYLKETGGADTGLNVLDSLKAWRKGWIAGGQKRTIDGYAAVNFRNPDEVKQAIYLHGGVTMGVELPDDAMDEFTRGKPWTNTRLRPDPEGGHCIEITGWTPDGFTGITWAQYEPLSPPWLKKYGDEGWVVFDTPNQKARRAVDFAAVRRHQQRVAA